MCQPAGTVPSQATSKAQLFLLLTQENLGLPVPAYGTLPGVPCVKNKLSLRSSWCMCVFSLNTEAGCVCMYGVHLALLWTTAQSRALTLGQSIVLFCRLLGHSLPYKGNYQEEILSSFHTLLPVLTLYLALL